MPSRVFSITFLRCLINSREDGASCCDGIMNSRSLHPRGEKSNMIFKNMSKCGAMLMSGSLAAAAGLRDPDRGQGGGQPCHQPVPGVHTERMILFGGQSHPKFTRTLAARLGVKVRVKRGRLHIIIVNRWVVCSKRPSATRNTAFRSRKASMARTSTLSKLAGAGHRCSV